MIDSVPSALEMNGLTGEVAGVVAEIGRGVDLLLAVAGQGVAADALAALIAEVRPPGRPWDCLGVPQRQRAVEFVVEGLGAQLGGVELQLEVGGGELADGDVAEDQAVAAAEVELHVRADLGHVRLHLGEAGVAGGQPHGVAVRVLKSWMTSLPWPLMTMKVSAPAPPISTSWPPPP